MSARDIDGLIETLAAEARPVRVLPPPLRRAGLLLGLLAAAGLILVMAMADIGTLTARYAGREHMMMLEMAATLATGVMAVTGAFFLSIPGRSPRWLIAPVPPLIAWIALSGMGCWRDLASHGAGGWSLGHSVDCLLFILGASLAVGAPLLWLLSRASPIDPLRVALLAGLGSAALAAFLVQFFHPFTITFLDLGVHLIAVGLVVAAIAALNRRALAGPAGA